MTKTYALQGIKSIQAQANNFFNGTNSFSFVYWIGGGPTTLLTDALQSFECLTQHLKLIGSAYGWIEYQKQQQQHK